MGKVENKIQNIMSGQPFPNAALVLQPPGYQPSRQLVLTDGWDGWMGIGMDGWGDGPHKKLCFSAISQKLLNVFC